MDRLSKNFIWMSAANIAANLLNMVTFIYLARVLMAEAFGYLSYAMTFAFYFMNFIDFGLSTYGMRAIARDREMSKKLVSEILSFKFVVACCLFAVALVVVLFIEKHHMAVRLLIIESCLLLFTAALATEWVFQGLEKMHIAFISLATTATLQLGLIYFAVKAPADAVKVPAAFFCATLPMLFILLHKVRFKFMIKVLDIRNMFGHLSSSIIIWLISVCAQTYNSLDIVILGLFRGAEEVGYFTVARRIVGAIGGFLLFLANAALPHLSRTFHSDSEQFHKATKKFAKIAICVTVFVFIPLIIFSQKLIILTVGRDYLPARLPLDLMVAGMILVFFNMPYSTGLIASGFEKSVLKQAAVGAVLSLGLNFILVPKYGMIGASITFLFVEAIAFVWIIWVYHKKIGLRAGL